MLRRVRFVVFGVLVLAPALWATVRAQDLGTVTFSPTTQQVYDAASGNNPGRIAADPTSDNISFTIQAWGNVHVVVQTNMPVPFELVADYSSDARGAVPEVVLSTTRQTVYRANWGFWLQTAKVNVTYWLRLSGAVPAGTYTVTVTYTLVGANSVTNTIRVTIPPLLAVRVSGGDTLAFNYGNAPQVYYAAIGGTLPPTSPGTTMTSVDVLSTGSYTLLAALTPASAGPWLPSGAIRLNGKALSASPTPVASGNGTGGSFVPVITPSDFALAISGLEQPGTYNAVLSYTVASP
jgi:hypothetical protein